MKAPNINIKDILAKLSVLKNNLSLLVPILIAVVGLLLVVPTRILSARLRATVEKNSVQVGRDIDRIISDLSSDELKILSEKDLAAIAQDANEIERLMDQASKRQLLSYPVFLDTNDPSSSLFEEFGKRYQEGMVTLFQGLNATDGPPWTEVQRALASAPQAGDVAGMTSRGTSAINFSDRGGGATLSLDQLTDVQRRMFDQLCLGKASGAKVYAAPTDMAGHTYWGQWVFENRDRAYQDCWYWQLGYWIIEDVVATVQQMNGSADSVLNAPVKRLMNVSFTFRNPALGNERGYGGGGAAGRLDAAAERPAYVTGLGKGLVTPCTARVCGENGDVVQFQVKVVLDPDQVMPFIQALCTAKEHRYRGPNGNEPEQKYLHNQITVLEMTVQAVEPIDTTHMRYRYGDRPVSTLTLICEYLFSRTPSYEKNKPVQVKKDLGQPVDTAPAAEGQPAAGQ